MRGCVRGTARYLLRIKRSRGVICVLRSNVPAAATNPQSRKGAERSPSAAPPRALTALGWILRRSTWTSAPDTHAASLGSSAVKEKCRRKFAGETHNFSNEEFIISDLMAQKRIFVRIL